MAAQIKFCVVGHHSREVLAKRLSERLDATLFIDPGKNGSNWNHRRALEWASTQKERVVVLEDDALIVEGFDGLVSSWLDRFPDNILSFYLGTGRPPQRQIEIALRLIDADKHQLDYVMLGKLLHGVCYSIPHHFLPRILECWDERLGADYAISANYKGRVIYPVFSLVDHADNDIVEKHPDKAKRLERRKAWRLYRNEGTWPD